MAEPSRYWRPHIVFSWHGERFVWCHIRKNGSSALLRFIGELLQRTDQPVKLHLLPKKPRHLPHLNEVKELRADDRLVLVYRDPLERFYSAFCDKLIAQRGAEQLLSDVSRRTGNIAALTLETFVADYLVEPCSEIDPHFLPQSMHMFDVDYAETLPATELYFWVERNFGPALANKFFLAKTNALEEKRYSLEGAWKTRIGDLQTQFLETRAFPRPEDLFHPEILLSLHSFYESDRRFATLA
ncbi:Sulfotransferase family protein [Roseibium album]|nr:Sulfotransferase family protein [Roseibium album]